MSFTIIWYIASFGSHRDCNSGVITLLVFHVTLQDHVIKGSCIFMCRKLPKVSQYPAKSGNHKHCGSRSVMDLFFHVISQQHLIKKVMLLNWWEPVMESYNLAKLVSRKHCCSGYIKILVIEWQDSSCLLKVTLTNYA